MSERTDGACQRRAVSTCSAATRRRSLQVAGQRLGPRRTACPRSTSARQSGQRHPRQDTNRPVRARVGTGPDASSRAAPTRSTEPARRSRKLKLKDRHLRPGARLPAPEAALDPRLASRRIGRRGCADDQQQHRPEGGEHGDPKVTSDAAADPANLPNAMVRAKSGRRTLYEAGAEAEGRKAGLSHRSRR